MVRKSYFLFVAFLLWRNPAVADDVQNDLSSQLQPYQTEAQVASGLGLAQDRSFFDYDLTPKSQVAGLLSALQADDGNIAVLQQAYDALKQKNRNLSLENGSLSLEIQESEQSPESCILNELKNMQSSENETNEVRFNCIRKYVLKNIPLAADILNNGSPNNFADAQLTFSPGIQSIPPSTQSITVEIDNQSQLQIIAAAVAIVNKGNARDTHDYILYADYPIDAYQVGTMTADVLLNIPDSGTFSSSYQWYFIHVWAIAARR